jgi:hypothetical protein
MNLIMTITKMNEMKLDMLCTDSLLLLKKLLEYEISASFLQVILIIGLFEDCRVVASPR